MITAKEAKQYAEYSKYVIPLADNILKDIEIKIEKAAKGGKFYLNYYKVFDNGSAQFNIYKRLTRKERFEVCRYIEDRLTRNGFQLTQICYMNYRVGEEPFGQGDYVYLKVGFSWE